MMLILDLVLIAGLVTFATLTLTARATFSSIVLFISTGLLIALAWARLGAPDIAIAEAAIGAGLTGALLLAAWRRLQPGTVDPESDAESTSGEQQGAGDAKQ
ncbi:Uncharacterized MnhB-related membrane protein [Modicisalibacter ilicicola DSM 19980]|uniref:Uncharacterized MnhB-related membrane protein n=1 Tax=Modicisalibacter ilicicola DSM 19980 TaxID=1121942 RepID=A0A1M4ZQG2_9GAMM|nr:DUF4040 domain-containing protein [Halomonas ilicicola]SHF20165.1 Uncharacterized MnhB-related membrane protein [Halomonas ilicicola DSM 19980]